MKLTLGAMKTGFGQEIGLCAAGLARLNPLGCPPEGIFTRLFAIIPKRRLSKITFFDAFQEEQFLPNFGPELINRIGKARWKHSLTTAQ
jgi:hypothetical protein